VASLKRIVLFLCVLSAAVGASATPCAEPAPPTPWSRWIEIGGSRVHYADTAPGSDLPVLLLLPGFLGSAVSFETVAEILSRDFRVVIPDLPGFGWSDPPGGGCTVEDRLDFIAAFSDRLGLEAVFLAGSSLGSAIAIRYAIEHPHQVRRLVLLSPFGLAGQHAVVSRMERYDGMLPLIVLLVCRSLLERELRKQVRDPGELTEDVIDSFCRPFRTIDGRRVVVDVSRDILHDSFFDEDLPLVPQPTLALAGSEDAYQGGEVLGALERGVPSCTTQRLEGYRHMLQLDAPVEVAELIGRFCLAGQP
jgi:pimeloyl-ACP methyl ester carboxylesterase